MTASRPALGEERVDMTENFLRWIENAMLQAGFTVQIGDPRLASLALQLKKAVEAERAEAQALRRELDEALTVIRVAQAVGKYWIDAILASNELSRTGMSHPVAMVMAALDGETDPIELGISEDGHAAIRAALAQGGDR